MTRGALLATLPTDLASATTHAPSTDLSGAAQANHAVMSAASDMRHGAAGRALRVFVIEDDVVLRDLILQALRDIPGVEVLFYADNEISATNWLSSNDSAWDLAVVDLHLRQGSGVGALNWCTTRRPGQHVVVLSGGLSREVRQKCLDLRADAVFDKATEMDAFLEHCGQLARSVRCAA